MKIGGTHQFMLNINQNELFYSVHWSVETMEKMILLELHMKTFERADVVKD